MIGAVLGLWLLVPAVRHRLAVAYPRDPRRAYNNEERQAGFRRAGHRCEFDIWMGLARCKSPPSTATTGWPHSRGGATTMPNLVAGCAWHNTSKGATMPTAAQTHRIARRRRGYFPAGEPTAPGERYRTADESPHLDLRRMKPGMGPDPTRPSANSGGGTGSAGAADRVAFERHVVNAAAPTVTTGVAPEPDGETPAQGRTSPRPPTRSAPSSRASPSAPSSAAHTVPPSALSPAA